MTEKLNNFETVENVTIHNHGEETPGHVTIHISGGTHTHYYGLVLPQQEASLDDVPIEQLEGQSAKTGKVVRSCQKRLSELRQRVCTFDGTQTPDAEFWQELYETCKVLERDLDGVLK